MIFFSLSRSCIVSILFPIEFTMKGEKSEREGERERERKVQVFRSKSRKGRLRGVDLFVHHQVDASIT